MLDQDANVTTYSYDANGALTQKSMGGVLTSFSYNGMDKLTDVISPTGTVNYSYDALDRRITRSEDGYTRKLIYGAASDLYDHELNTEGALVASMLKGPDGLISLTSYVGAPITAYQNFNPHGDTTLISSPQGEEWIAARFDAFGNPLDGWELSYGYTSKWLREKDRDTMMIRMGVRDYDPALGRFVSADPLRGDPTRPQSRNRYPYGLNDPLTMYDLNGRQAAEAVAGGAIFVTLPASAPVVIVGGAAGAGVGATGAFLIFDVKPKHDLIQAGLYDNYRALVPPPSSHPDAYTHYRPGSEICTLEGSQTPPLFHDDLLAGRVGVNYSGSGTFNEGAALRDAALGSGNFGVGSATRNEAERAGKNWVGPGSRTLSDGSGLISADGRRVYRRPSSKKGSGRTQANYERRNADTGEIESNAHVDIKD